MINTKAKDNCIDVYFNSVYLGYFYIECDGFHVFMPHPRDGSGGFWSEQYLCGILELLKELNKGWNEHLCSALNG